MVCTNFVAVLGNSVGSPWRKRPNSTPISRSACPSTFAGVKPSVVDAAIWSVAPVSGLRPLTRALSLTLGFAKPLVDTSSVAGCFGDRGKQTIDDLAGVTLAHLMAGGEVTGEIAMRPGPIVMASCLR